MFGKVVIVEGDFNLYVVYQMVLCKVFCCVVFYVEDGFQMLMIYFVVGLFIQCQGVVQDFCVIYQGKKIVVQMVQYLLVKMVLGGGIVWQCWCVEVMYCNIGGSGFYYCIEYGVLQCVMWQLVVGFGEGQ